MNGNCSFGAVIFCAALLLSPSIAQAQLAPEVQTGSRLATKPKEVDAAREGLYTKVFARCVYAAHADTIDRLLRFSDPVSIDFEAVGLSTTKLSSQLTMDACLSEAVESTRLSVGMTFPPARLRALMLEEAYLNRNKAPLTISPGSSEFVERPFISTGEDLSKARGMGQLADCVVFRDVADADGLLRTSVGQAVELAAAKKLAPTFGECLVQGQQISFNVKTIRAIAADGLWSRYAYGVGPGAAASSPE